MKKRMLILAFAGMMITATLAGCKSLKETDVIATVGDQKITADIANFYARYNQAQYETYYSGYLGENMWSTEAEKGKTYEETVKDTVLEELQRMLVLEKHMKEYEVEISKEEKQAIDEAAKTFDEANPLEGKEKISGSKKTVNRLMTLMTIQQKMNTAIGSKADTEVTDEEAAQKSMQYVMFSYKSTDEDGNAKDLTDKEKKEMKKAAEEFAKGAKEAKDFEAYSKEKEQEIKTVTFDKDSQDPSADLIKAADKLKEGEATDVIETDAGCYVGKVTSLLDREATDAKKETIVQERKTKLYDDTCDKWLKKEKIEVNKSVWKKIDFKEMTVTMKQGEEDPYADPVTTDDQSE